MSRTSKTPVYNPALAIMPSISKIRMILLMDAKIWMVSLIIMFAVRPICTRDAIFKISSVSPVIMFDISKIRPKSILGPVKAQKFSLCLMRCIFRELSTSDCAATHKNTVECCYNAVQYNKILHTSLQWREKNSLQNKCRTADPDRQNLRRSGKLSFFVIYKFCKNCAAVRQVSNLILKTGIRDWIDKDTPTGRAMVCLLQEFWEKLTL